jgi:hypothetical protein
MKNKIELFLFAPFYKVFELNNFIETHKNDNIGVTLNLLKEHLPAKKKIIILKDFEEGSLPQIN